LPVGPWSAASKKHGNECCDAEQAGNLHHRTSAGGTAAQYDGGRSDISPQCRNPDIPSAFNISGWEHHMPKHNQSIMDDNDLRAFYKACGLHPKIIEGAIKTRYQEPPKTAGRETDLVKRLRGEQIPQKMRRAK
jgi:hypothetical protein